MHGSKNGGGLGKRGVRAGQVGWRDTERGWEDEAGVEQGAFRGRWAGQGPGEGCRVLGAL